MAKCKGLIKLRGSVHGLTFYKSHGLELVRKTAGPTRADIMTAPAYARTREHISEFGGCSRIAKAFRTSLAQVKPLTDGDFGNRLTKLFNLISLHAEGTRGQRPIELSRHRPVFRNFECNVRNKLSHALPAQLVLEHNEQRTMATITNPRTQRDLMNVPDTATHFQLTQALGLVSDYIFSPTAKGYVPAEPALDAHGVVSYSDFYSLEGDEVPEITLHTTLPQGTVPTDRLSVAQAVGIRFFEQLGSAYYPMHQGQALTIVKVF